MLFHAFLCLVDELVVAEFWQHIVFHTRSLHFVRWWCRRRCHCRHQCKESFSNRYNIKRDSYNIVIVSFAPDKCCAISKRIGRVKQQPVDFRLFSSIKCFTLINLLVREHFHNFLFIFSIFYLIRSYIMHSKCVWIDKVAFACFFSTSSHPHAHKKRF